MLNCEFEVLELSGLPINQIQQKMISVGQFDGEEVYIRTAICGEEDKPILVFVHGYAASGPLYFKIIKYLSEHFCLVMMDVIGMGGSSRPNDYKSSEFSP